MQPFHSIRWKLTFAYTCVVLISISVLGVYLSVWTENSYVSSLRTELVAESRLTGRLSANLAPSGMKAIDPLAKQIGNDLGRRITIIRADGTVLGDSHHDPSTMESHSNRFEFQRALKYGTGWTIRDSSTLKSRMLYVATRFGDGTHITGVARVAESLSMLDVQRSKIHRAFFIAALIAFVVAAVTGAKVSSNITRPILAMNAIARKFAKGDLKHRVEVNDKPGDEIDELAGTLNVMAYELRTMMSELAEEKTMLGAILSKTDSGLMVVDNHSRIRMLNPAAAQMLGVTPSQVQSKTLIEGILNHDLSELVNRVLRTGKPASLEIEFAIPDQTFLNVYATPLENQDGPNGAVIVMHDMTSTKRIDSVRRDFIANVSHELRTPLASIKAMAETIVLRGRKDPEMALKFAENITGQADRLAALSEDLLDLSKIEAGQTAVHKENLTVADMVVKMITEFTPVSARRNIELASIVPGGLGVYADSDAVCQILTNLIDNAIKYTPDGGKVTVSAVQAGNRAAISISDTGIGIPKEDQSRIFERFYRVDKARSRESGGTGLGLSIVRHLVESHGGRVTVQSTPGEGSTFTFTLPRG